MEQKLKMESVNLTEQNIDKIAELFPQVITEVADPSGAKNEDGTPVLKRAIDFEKLKLVLSAGTGDYVVADDERERYEFTWVGKRQAMIDAATPIRKTLRPCPEESKNWETTENLYIEGDNLEVLKLLQESYLGKVKMIYIDPPYNTGKDFVYRDNFAQSREEYEAELGMFDKEENKLFQNTETNGRFHSDWCSMIYPRLQLARNLLTDDGVIFISIDDNEVRNLKNICDEVFGEDNFIGNMIWQSATDNNPRQISTEHEYILCYAKQLVIQQQWVISSDKAKLIQKKYIELKSQYDGDIKLISSHLKKWIRQNNDDLKGVSHYSYIDDIGVYYPGNSSNTKPGGYMYDIIHPITKKVCAKPDYGYRWAFETFKLAQERGDVEWGNDETVIPKIKKRINTATEILKSIYYEDNRYWTKYLTQLFGNKRIFDNPKSVNLIHRLLKFTTTKNDLILDFFSGSATTAHAVMQLNAEDGGNRKFIMVQLPEKTDEKSEAYKAGYKNICEIGKERIRRAGAKIEEQANKKNIGVDAGQTSIGWAVVDENNKINAVGAKIKPIGEEDKHTNLTINIENKPLDIGFRVLKLDTTNMKDVYYAAGDYSQKDLFDMVSNIKDDRTDIDLLYGCLLSWGLQLSYPHTTEMLNGSAVHTVDTPLYYSPKIGPYVKSRKISILANKE